jgi:hypothetical protein
MAGNTSPASRRQPNTRNTIKHKQARILWPALGFPEVVTAGPGQDSATAIDILFVSEVPPSQMTAEIVAHHLRYVPWSDRHTRYQEPHPGNSFLASQIEVKEVPIVAGDALSHQLHFAHGGVQAGLAKSVLSFYKKAGLEYLYEARVAAAASFGSPTKMVQYQLFWINRKRSDTSRHISDEMRMLIEKHAKKTRFGNDGVPQLKYMEKSNSTSGFLDEYEFDYNRAGGGAGPERTEVLHPLFVLPPGKQAHLDVGHLTDMHVDIRIDRLPEMLAPAARKKYNNFNDNFVELYEDARKYCDALLMTGDLVDYGRGYYGRPSTTYDSSGNQTSRKHNFGSDNSYWRDRNWFLFYKLLASGDKTYAKPVYTILGNHDWRLHPYHSLASDGPSPEDYGLTRKELEDAHGPTEGGHGGNTWYGPDTLDSTPVYTAIESIKWYLLLINPFLDYTFTYPGEYPMLMLDWAKNEKLIMARDEHPDPSKIKKDFLQDTLAKFNRTKVPSPIARDSLSTLQKNLVGWFCKHKAKAKIFGIHAPIVGAYGIWKDADLLKPKHAFDAKRADHGSIEHHREWLLNRLIDAKVKIVATGHIHRTNVFVLYRSNKYPDPIGKAIDPAKAGDHDWPLMLNTTSMGPFGRYRDKTAEPAYAIARVTAAGRVEKVLYREKGRLWLAPLVPIREPPKPMKEGTALA